MEETLASGGITGLLTMAMLLAMRVYEARKAKANGGSTYDNIKQNPATQGTPWGNTPPTKK